MRLGLNDSKAAERPTGVPSPGARTEAVARFEQFLAGRQLRLTAARRAIVEAVLDRDGHFPIEDVVRDLKRRGIRGSKATVYRTLPLLTEAGILQPAVITSETKSYEASVGREHHDHLVCRGCGKVVEFEFEAFEILQREIASRHGFALEGHHHQLFGRCPACRAQAAAPAPAASAIHDPVGPTDET